MADSQINDTFFSPKKKISSVAQYSHFVTCGLGSILSSDIFFVPLSSMYLTILGLQELQE